MITSTPPPPFEEGGFDSCKIGGVVADASAVGKTVADADDPKNARFLFDFVITSPEPERVVFVGAEFPWKHRVRDEGECVRQGGRQAEDTRSNLHPTQPKQYPKESCQRYKILVPGHLLDCG